MRPCTTASLCLGILASSASAIVIRHDVPDAAYLANDADYPAVFALQRNDKGSSECVATVIAQRWAITAGHCVPQNWRPKPGSKGLATEVGGREALIDLVVHHPESALPRPFSSNFTDVALLRFAEPLTHVTPVALYDRSDEVGQLVVIPGWGGSGDGEKALRKEEDGLFRVAVNRVDAADDRYVDWKFDDPRSGNKALTLEGISGPGDSGGPALVKTRNGWATLGVSSHQRTFNGPEGRYGVVERYTRISKILPWIRSEQSRKRP